MGEGVLILKKWPCLKRKQFGKKEMCVKQD